MRLSVLIDVGRRNLERTWRLPLTLVVLLACSQLQAGLTVTQLNGQGVMLEDGQGTRVMIDGLVAESYSVYGGLPAELVSLLEKAQGPFADVSLALVSHQHHEHNQPVFACRFMQSARNTVLASSSQVIDLMREKCRSFVTSSPRIQVLNAAYGQPESISVAGAQVTAFLLSHGGGPYARIINLGHLVEIGGMRVLHVGSAAMQADDFRTAGVDKMNIDVAIIPFQYFQPGPCAGIIRRYLDVTYKIATHIPPSELAEIRDFMRLEFPRVLVLEKPLDQARFSNDPPPPPGN